MSRLKSDKERLSAQVCAKCLGNFFNILSLSSAWQKEMKLFSVSDAVNQVIGLLLCLSKMYSLRDDFNEPCMLFMKRYAT